METKNKNVVREGSGKKNKTQHYYETLQGVRKKMWEQGNFSFPFNYWNSPYLTGIPV